MANKAKNAVFWSLIERLSTQVVSFILGIILARLLSPNDYGIIGITTIFVLVSNVFIDAGFANALIRKSNRTESDLSTAFFFNLILGIFVYILLFSLSPLIAAFFEEPILIILVRIVGLNVFFNSLCVVQTALLTANLDIKRQTYINICAQIPAGLIAVFLAYYGFGVYALAFQTILSAFLKSLFLWIQTKWYPSVTMSRESFIYLWSFGSRLLCANLIGVAFDQVYSVLIGKYVGKEQLGYFSKAQGLNSNVNSISTGIIQRVSLPILSRYQDDILELSEKFRNIMKLLVMLLAPITAFLFFSSRAIIVFLWTEKWIEAAVLFQFLIICSMFNPIGQLSLSLLQAVGRTGLMLKLEFPKKALYCVYIAIGFCYGVKGLVVAMILISITAAIINMWATKKVISYSYLLQFVDILKYIVLAFSSAFICSKVVGWDNGIVYVIVLFVSHFVFYCVILYTINDKLFKNQIFSIVIH